jgi:hypothetical protein
MFADPAGRIYVESGNRLLRSQDAGVSWSELGPTGRATNTVRSLHSDSDALCLGTSEGVWCSENDGASFTAVNAGLPGGSVPVVGLVRDGQRYAALTADDGVFVSDAATAADPLTFPDDLAVAVTPNPASSAATVTVSMRQPGLIDVGVFDSIGRRVATLHSGALAAGDHRMPIGLVALRPGVYLIRVTGAGTVATARTVVL